MNGKERWVFECGVGKMCKTKRSGTVQKWNQRKLKAHRHHQDGTRTLMVGTVIGGGMGRYGAGHKNQRNSLDGGCLSLVRLWL